MCQSSIQLPFSPGEAEAFLVDRGFSVEYKGPSDVAIHGFSDPGDYHVGTALWLGSVRYLRLGDGLHFDDVALLFAPHDFDALDEFPAVMVCADPRNAFMTLVEAVASAPAVAGIHETAIISEGVKLGRNVFVGPHAVLEDGAIIGDETVIEAGCVIRGCTKIGRKCHLFPNCCIGSPGYGFRKNGEGGFTRLPHMGSVIIEDDVEIGACTVIDRGTFRDTVIKRGTKIDSLTTIGHNVCIGANCLVIGGAVGGNCTVGNDSEVIHACLKNRLEIGDGSKVGIGSVVLKDIDGHSECFGNPARVIAHK